jgi:hypothetical protein
MQSILKDLENITYLEKSVTMTSTLKDNQLEDVALLAEAVVASLRPASETVADSGGLIDVSALFNVSYGLFILHTREENGKDNACVVNSFIQCADKPQRVLLSVNKLNYSHDLVAKTGIFNISILTESTPFSTSNALALPRAAMATRWRVSKANFRGRKMAFTISIPRRIASSRAGCFKRSTAVRIPCLFARSPRPRT